MDRRLEFEWGGRKRESRKRLLQRNVSPCFFSVGLRNRGENQQRILFPATPEPNLLGACLPIEGITCYFLHNSHPITVQNPFLPLYLPAAVYVESRHFLATRFFTVFL